MTSEFFKVIKQWEFDWQGRKARLPVFYYDNTSFTGIYTASTSKVRELLPHKGMNPIELYPGRCLAAFTAFEYRETDIDPYNEFSISFLVALDKMQIPGITAGLQMSRRCFTAYVWQLPVTTEIARVGGVELYGFPKFIADIQFTRSGDWITCDLSEKGQQILSIKGKVLPVSRGKTLRYITYSMMGDIVLAANVYINPLEFAQSRSGQDASLELGTEHAIAKALAGIELSANPLMYQYCPQNEAILFGGRNLIDN